MSKRYIAVLVDLALLLHEEETKQKLATDIKRFETWQTDFWKEIKTT